jgi:hypothetical protein
MAGSFDADFVTGDVVTATELNKVGSVRIYDSGVVGVGGVASLDFSSIPQVYASLQVDFRVKAEGAASWVLVRCNNDANAVYGHAYDTMDQGSTRVGGGAAGLTALRAGVCTSAGWTVGTFTIPFFTYSDTFHGMTGTFWRQDTYHGHIGAQYEPTVAAAISRLTFLMDVGDIAENSRIIVYGKRD